KNSRMREWQHSAHLQPVDPFSRIEEVSMLLPTTRRVSMRIIAGATLLFALNGCVNLDDAAGLSRLSAEARVSLPRVSNGVADTCARQNTLFEHTPAAERPPAAHAQD